MTEILKRYLAKSKEPVLSVILAAGVWLANEVKHAVAEVSAQLTKMDARIAAIERRLGSNLAQK
jgi:hypothetical protein